VEALTVILLANLADTLQQLAQGLAIKLGKFTLKLNNTKNVKAPTKPKNKAARFTDACAAVFLRTIARMFSFSISLNAFRISRTIFF
jgi:hypothetical protein